MADRMTLSPPLLFHTKPTILLQKQETYPMTTATQLQTGKPAPQFSLSDQSGDTVHLKDLLGQWVVLWAYPKDDSPG